MTTKVKELEAINSIFLNFHLVCVAIIITFLVIIILLIVKRVIRYCSIEERLYRKLKKYVVYSCNESLCERLYKEDEIQHICERNEYIIVDKDNKYKISMTNKGIEVLRILSNNNYNDKLFNGITIALTIMISVLAFCTAYSNWEIQIINAMK